MANKFFEVIIWKKDNGCLYFKYKEKESDNRYNFGCVKQSDENELIKTSILFSDRSEGILESHGSKCFQ